MNPEPLKFRPKKSMKKRNLTFFDTNGHKRARTLSFGGGGGWPNGESKKGPNEVHRGVDQKGVKKSKIAPKVEK